MKVNKILEDFRGGLKYLVLQIVVGAVVWLGIEITALVLGFGANIFQFAQYPMVALFVIFVIAIYLAGVTARVVWNWE